MQVNVETAEALRRKANASLPDGQAKASLTAVLARSVAWSLERHPMINSRLEGDSIWLLPEVNLGIAVALDQGLIVPVIRNAAGKGIYQLANEIQDLTARAKSGKLRADQLTDGTFTISNLGMYGVS
jgi:pyruvate dehydrogenase E2 component (dihydrolipoamide acetyltransferase)